MFHTQQREKHFFLERQVYDLNPTVFSLPLFSLTYLSMPLLALVSSYRICIWEKCFQTSSAHKPNDRSSSASNTIELWCHLQNNPSSILGLRLELELSVHSCCQQPACSAAVIGLLSSPESRWESTARVHDWPLQMHVFTWGQDGEHALCGSFVMANVNAGRWLLKLRKLSGSFHPVVDAPSHSDEHNTSWQISCMNMFICCICPIALKTRYGIYSPLIVL